MFKDHGDDKGPIQLMAEHSKTYMADINEANEEVIRKALMDRGWTPPDCSVLDRIMKEYNESSGDASWEGDHPIVQMASEIDTLKRLIRSEYKRGLIDGMSQCIDEIKESI